MASVKFLPPYSPDFNPIEKMWSKTKKFFRVYAARSQQELSLAITQTVEPLSCDVVPEKMIAQER
ncbi:MAG: transposase [Spirochaetales bacterium]|jgi:transposase|nr:transposase [Spirochaetales bacterium]